MTEVNGISPSPQPSIGADNGKDKGIVERINKCFVDTWNKIPSSMKTLMGGLMLIGGSALVVSHLPLWVGLLGAGSALGGTLCLVKQCSICSVNSCGSHLLEREEKKVPHITDPEFQNSQETR